jgi:hypothetical protein
MQKPKQTIKAGTRVQLHGTPAMGGFPAVPPEPATIARWTKVSGDVPNHLTPASPTNGGWHVVQFSDGGKLLAHETRFRVIDNRA